ncbi:MAG: AAA family ATPase, partial [Patescibacteria group bacterium]
KRHLTKYDLDKIVSTEYLAKRIGRAKVLIIDEVSMLSPGTLEMVEAVCRGVKQDEAPFGGLQVILVGDFFQLPPIVRRDESDDLPNLWLDEAPPLFAYDSTVWARAQLITCYLSEQYRQDDEPFLKILAAIRTNTFMAEHLQHLATRKIDLSEIPLNKTKLFSRNLNVDQVNDRMLGGIAGETRTFLMEEEGVPALAAILKKGCLSPETLRLKIGAVVMFTKNNLKDGYVNGTLGVVQAFSLATGQPIIKLKTGQQIEVSPLDWSVEENGKVRAKISQLPLRLAWAITVHKSQGMSLDEAVMDLSDVFEFGQGYVALSRVRRLSGLHLLGWNEKAFQVHPAVLAIDETFRSNSVTAEQA